MARLRSNRPQYCEDEPTVPLLPKRLKGEVPPALGSMLHQCATSKSGVHIKAVADLLGHSSIAITGDVYRHTSDHPARAAVDGRAGRLGL